MKKENERLQSKIKAKQEQMKKLKWVEEWIDHEIFNKKQKQCKCNECKKRQKKVKVKKNERQK